MSFSGNIKEELSRQWNLARHCQIAELAAILLMSGEIEKKSNQRYHVKVVTENLAVARKFFTLIKKTFNIEANALVRHNRMKNTTTYAVYILESEDARRVVEATKLIHTSEEKQNPTSVRNIIIQQTCCKRAFIRGVFLCAGSISDPNKSYHFEVVCQTEDMAEQVQSVINSFAMEAKVVARKKSFVVYLKEGSQIVDMLNIMEAHVALMHLENVRIVKEMRNHVNRKVNCETANLNKTVLAAVRQKEDILFIRDYKGFDDLPENLREIARVRLEYPDATLKELGDLLSPPIGKSGVNHRLRKLSEIAEKLRET
ncbi:DNA-binding protein WhiA [Lachnospiraceae bacterium OttesenSCG-928-E19]|nr:DNA-binding protein WhiA [Lachnospiraceae bacterium OttesenSCG-928-E19]